jgi:hypothetical protein
MFFVWFVDLFKILNYWIYGIKVWCYWEHPCGTHLKPGEYHWELVGNMVGTKFKEELCPLTPSQKEIRWAFLSASAVGSIDCMQIKHISSMEIHTKPYQWLHANSSCHHFWPELIQNFPQVWITTLYKVLNRLVSRCERKNVMANETVGFFS